MENMKEGLNFDAIRRISDAFSKVIPEFNHAAFQSQVCEKLETLELKERVNWVIEVLSQHLPKNIEEIENALCAIPDIWDYGDPNDNKRGFAAWPIIDYIGVHGLDSPKVSLRILEAITHMFSAEFAIRPFFENHYDTTIKRVKQWCNHKSEHVRRLASEGSRPRLPWGPQLKNFVHDPTPLLPILEQLKNDPELYVRRSVANNLNDIGKDHPELLLEWLLKWKAEDQGKSDWVINHAARSLVKKGHPKSFALLGYTINPQVSVDNFSCPKTVKMGQELPFSFDIISHKASQNFVLDYVVYFMKANGKAAPKVFKLKNLTFEDVGTMALQKRQSFKPISTRKYYPGTHSIALQVNGVEMIKRDFELVEDK